MNAEQKDGYIAGIVSLVMAVIFFLVGFHSNLSEISGQVIIIFAGLFGISTIGCIVWPTTFGQVIAEYFKRIGEKPENQTTGKKEKNTVIIQNIGTVQGDSTTVVNSANSGNKFEKGDIRSGLIPIIDGEHSSKGKGNVTALEIEGLALIKPGTKSVAEGEGNVTATRIKSRKSNEK